MEGRAYGRRMPFTLERVNEGEMYGKWAEFFQGVKLDRHRTNFTVAGSYSATLDFSKQGFWSINLYRHDENDVFVASRKAHFHIRAGKVGLEVFHYDSRGAAMPGESEPRKSS